MAPLVLHSVIKLWDMRGFGIKNVNKKCDKIRMIFEWPGKIESVSFGWRNQNIYTLWWIVSGIGAFLSKFVIGSQNWVTSGILFSNLRFIELLFCFSSPSRSSCSDQTPSWTKIYSSLADSSNSHISNISYFLHIWSKTDPCLVGI